MKNLNEMGVMELHYSDISSIDGGCCFDWIICAAVDFGRGYVQAVNDIYN